MSELPKISLITIVRNGEAHLARAFASVAAQNYPNLEYIVIDGGSTDGTLDIIKSHSHLITLWKSERDNGTSHASNKGVHLATGDFFGFLNADDELTPEALHKVGRAILENPGADIISGGAEVISPDGSRRLFDQPAIVDFSMEAALAGITLFNSRFYRRALHAQTNGFRESYPGQSYFVANDREFLIKLALEGAKGVSVPGLLCTYNVHRDSMTFGFKHRVGVQREHLWIAAQITQKYSLSKGQKDMLDQWLAQECAVLALYALQAKKPAATIPALRYALGHPLHFGVAILKLAARFINNRTKRIIKAS